ncbi:MAG: Mov34/MPN/PAD-1 family protein, partial [Patescibacteria group bacterium]
MLKINSNNIEIKICSSVFQVMRKYIQLGSGSLEAGGILIGKENISDDNIIIRYITEPYASDKRRYNRFIRKDNKHIDIFNEVFNLSNEIYCYVGDWHTHDE